MPAKYISDLKFDDYQNYVVSGIALNRFCAAMQRYCNSVSSDKRDIENYINNCFLTEIEKEHAHIA